ncbi:MAG TPA: papain-like cysteine protease family protein [Kribbellaceae bacterium]
MRRVRTSRPWSLLLAIIIGFASLVPLAPAASAAPTSWYLYVDGQAQQKSNWCWAATGNSIADYYGYWYTQNQFCNMAFGQPLDWTCANNQATLANDQRAFNTIGIYGGWYISGTLSFSTIVTEISNYRPIMTRIGWTSGGGHMMDIIGYDSSDTTIEYYDPWPDNYRYNDSTYWWYRSNSQFTWTHTLYQIGA